MSFIKFESSREKERIREELRDAREKLLERAKDHANKRTEQQIKRELQGETDWLLPSVAKKLNIPSKHVSMKKKTKKEKKKKAKSKLKSKKKKYDSSSSSSSSSETDSSADSRKDHGSRRVKENQNLESVKSPKSTFTGGRESWMTDPLQLKTFTRNRVEIKKPNQLIEAYDPKNSVRELNPHWKGTGTGLPTNAFKKPDDNDNDDVRSVRNTSGSSGGWRKSSSSRSSTSSCPTESVRTQNLNKFTDKEKSVRTQHLNKFTEKEEDIEETKEFLTDKEMNELGAKIIKAEILGNTQLAAELKTKLENSRQGREAYKEKRQLGMMHTRKKANEEHILLTTTNKEGSSHPMKIESHNSDPYSLYGGRKANKQKRKRVQTHEHGERIQYFADDMKYNIKEMFEQEKYSTRMDSDSQFVNIAAKIKKHNDLDDTFTDTICFTDEAASQKKFQQATREHQQLAKQLDNCDRCFDSMKMNKQCLVSLADKIYLALPWHIGIQSGHCLLISTQHISCSTQLDEDMWEELNNYRKALTRMFASQQKDVIFFEIANHLQRRPHMIIHCVPIPEQEGEMAPFYFKKAIEESEREWSINKQLVSLKNKGLRNCIPKGMEYFWVNFGMDTGFAHVIEDKDRFPANFALEIIGGMLHLDPKKWRKLQKENDSIAKVKKFHDSWKKYDWTTT